MRQRVTILSLMGVITVVALGAVALREANQVWAAALFTLTLAILGLACLGAAFRRGRSRAAFAGFAAFGMGYMFLCFGPWCAAEVRPHLATTRLLEYAGPRVMRHRPADAEGLDGLLVGNPTRGWATTGDASASTGEMVAATGSPVVGSPWPATESFHRVGHSLFALLAALVSGLAARYFHDTRTPQPPAPGGEAP